MRNVSVDMDLIGNADEGENDEKTVNIQTKQKHLNQMQIMFYFSKIKTYIN